MMRRKANRRKTLFIGILAALVLTCGAVAVGYTTLSSSLTTYEESDGTQVKFKTDGDQFLKYVADDSGGQWQEMFVKGVNLGATIPGHYPGEFAITEDDYMRWFEQIDELGANVIRVYTVHKPIFYSSLVKYNKQKGEDPLYFIQGIWSPEEQLIERQDAYEEEIREQFKQEIEKAVTAVYGDVNVAEQPGESSGKYKTNAGKYLMAWHIGTEWDPEMVHNTNEKHKDAPRYEGEYFAGTEDASPFENWLAEMVDTAAMHEQKYGWQHPMTFTNWVTTDVLTHPGEPLFEEDLVSVDARHVAAVNWNAGYFASYHVYPYYPDFFRTDQTLQTIKNEQGEYNTYKAYLRKLKAEFTDMPIMVTEYGVPSSLGISHFGVGGRDQGGHNEEEQGEIDVSLTQDIYEEGYSGAILFMWQDEWFKKTWNTMPLEIPEDRRPFWINVLTNEKMFGILGMGPSKEDTLLIDGTLADWKDLPKDEVVTWQGEVEGIQSIQMTHDEGYLYLGVTLDNEFDPEVTKLYFGTDTIEGGNQPLEELPGKTIAGGDLETITMIGRDNESQVKIAKNYDFHARLYGEEGYWMLPEESYEEGDSFHPWKLAISLLMSPPDTKFAHPFEDHIVGTLKRGTSDRNAPQFDSLTAWQYSGNEVEIRIPWMLLGFGDPSSLQVINYEPLQERRAFSTSATEGIRLVPWIENTTTGQISWPGGSENTIQLQDITPYSWEPWEAVEYTEQLKQSYYAMQKLYHQLPD